MAVTYTVQYRLKGDIAWTDGPNVSRDVTNQMTATLTGLTTNQTYEFRWQRVVDGSVAASSNIIETVMPDIASIQTIGAGGQVNTSGTFVLNNASGTNVGTVVRTNSKLTLQFANASWKYARVNAMTLSGVPITGDFYTFNNTDNPSFNSPSVVSVKDASVIARTSNKTADVYLSRDYTYTLTLYPASGSSTFTIVSF